MLNGQEDFLSPKLILEELLSKMDDLRSRLNDGRGVGVEVVDNTKGMVDEHQVPPPRKCSVSRAGIRISRKG